MAADGLRVEIATELSLGLPGGCASAATTKNEKKRIYSDIDNENKSQVVGWPPVRSYRKKKHVRETSKFYVKISMDGTPFMRKIDLKNHKGYSDLFIAFEKLFSCFCSENTEYTPIYEDKDGDWMLVGDVPWEMFIDSCKKLRILKQVDSEEVQFKKGENRCVVRSNTAELNRNFSLAADAVNYMHLLA